MKYDVVIAGAGIAGASIAAELAPHASVLILEAEDVAGYHSTGRSAAFWSETYGGPYIQPLTTASGPWLRDGGYLEQLGSLHIGRRSEAAQIDAFLAEFAGSGVALERVDPRDYIPGLRADWQQAILEPSCAYIDVARLHADYLKAAKRAGAQLVLSSPLLSATRGSCWQIETKAGNFSADILVNAAGAWADQVAIASGVQPLDIQPYRRTMVQLKTEPAPANGSPLVAHIGGDFYWKPEAGGRIWLSPHDEIASPPCDAQPHPLDVAIAIDRFENVVDWDIQKAEHRWSGLRSFAKDRRPVVGFDRVAQGFFWCAGQGGFGIQTAPAIARISAALLRGIAQPNNGCDLDLAALSPRRF